MSTIQVMKRHCIILGNYVLDHFGWIPRLSAFELQGLHNVPISLVAKCLSPLRLMLLLTQKKQKQKTALKQL